MGGEPYNFAKRGVDIISSVSTLNVKRAAVYVDSNLVHLSEWTVNSQNNVLTATETSGELGSEDITFFNEQTKFESGYTLTLSIL